MSPLFGKSEYTTKKAIQEHALDAIDLTLGEIDTEGNTKSRIQKTTQDRSLNRFGSIIRPTKSQHPIFP